MSKKSLNKKNKQLSCFVDEKEKKKIEEIAKKENRTVSNYIYNKLFVEEK